MWRRRTAFARQAMVAFDTVVSAGAFAFALFVRVWLYRVDERPGVLAEYAGRILESFGGTPPFLDPSQYSLVLVALLPVWAFTLHSSGCGEFRMSIRRVFWRYLRAVSLGIGLFILMSFLFKLVFVARTFVILFAVTQFVFLLTSRMIVDSLLRYTRRHGGDAHRVVIVGTGERAVEFAHNLRDRAPMRVEILGFVSVPGDEAQMEARPQLGFVGSLDSILDRLAVDEVVFAVPGRQPETYKEALAACDDRGVDVLLTLPPQVSTDAKMEIAAMSGVGLPMLGLRRTPTSEFQLAVKRAIDLVGGMVGLLLVTPILIATAIAIRAESKGPVLFRQVRAGRNGRKFTMYKFRSMVIDAEAKRAELLHLNEMGGPVFKITRDPRITRVGRFIRKTSIDELPQLFNIVMGDMSLVGPRPPLPSEVEDYEAWQRRRLSVKPGLTGLWQVSGRNQIDFEEWMQLDLKYIDTWTIWLDVKIILQTVPVVLFRKGAS